MAVASQMEEKLKAITQEEDLKAKSESLETNQEHKDGDNSSESSCPLKPHRQLRRKFS